MSGTAAGTIGVHITGERWMAKNTSQQSPMREAVARLAYHLYELRGRQDGHDIEDWLRAENQLVRVAVMKREPRRI